MRFIDETASKITVSNGSVNVLSTSKMKTTFLLTLDVAAETIRCREWFHVYNRIVWQLTLDESCSTFRLCTGRIVIT